MGEWNAYHFAIIYTRGRDNQLKKENWSDAEPASCKCENEVNETRWGARRCVFHVTPEGAHGNCVVDKYPMLTFEMIWFHAPIFSTQFLKRYWSNSEHWWKSYGQNAACRKYLLSVFCRYKFYNKQKSIIILKKLIINRIMFKATTLALHFFQMYALKSTNFSIWNQLYLAQTQMNFLYIHRWLL